MLRLSVIFGALALTLFGWQGGAAQDSKRPGPSAPEGKGNPPSEKSGQKTKAPTHEQEAPQQSIPKPESTKSNIVAPNTSEKPKDEASHQTWTSEWWIVWLTGALAIVGLCQLVATIVYVYWMMRSVHVAQQSADAAKASADAATATVKTMEGTAKKQLRAYVYVVSASRHTEVSGKMLIDVKIKNAGLTPTYECSREGALKTLQHLDRLESYGIGFRSFTEPYFDSCSIFKEAVVSIVATLAKQERIKRSERTRAGLARVRSEGRRLGRPRVAVNPAEIARLRSQGLSLRAIGRSLGVSEGTVRRIASVAA